MYMYTAMSSQSAFIASAEGALCAQPASPLLMGDIAQAADDGRRRAPSVVSSVVSSFDRVAVPPPGTPPTQRSPPRRMLSGSLSRKTNETAGLLVPTEGRRAHEPSEDSSAPPLQPPPASPPEVIVAAAITRRAVGMNSNSPMSSMHLHPPSASVDAPLMGRAIGGPLSSSSQSGLSAPQHQSGDTAEHTPEDLDAAATTASASTSLGNGSGSTVASHPPLQPQQQHDTTQNDIVRVSHRGLTIEALDPAVAGAPSVVSPSALARDDRRASNTATIAGSSLVSDVESGVASPVTVAAAGTIVGAPLGGGPSPAGFGCSLGTPATAPGAHLTATAAAGADVVVSSTECVLNALEDALPSTNSPAFGAGRARHLVDGALNVTPSGGDFGSVGLSFEAPMTVRPATAATDAGLVAIDLSRPTTAAPVAVEHTAAALDDVPPPLLQVEFLSELDDSSDPGSHAASDLAGGHVGKKKDGRRRGPPGVVSPNLGPHTHSGRQASSALSDFAPGNSCADTVRPTDLSRDDTNTWGGSRRDAFGASPTRTVISDEEDGAALLGHAAHHPVLMSIELGGAAFADGGVIIPAPAPHHGNSFTTASASSQALRGSATSYPTRQRIVGFSDLQAGTTTSIAAGTATPSMVATPLIFAATPSSQLPPYRARAANGTWGTPPLYHASSQSQLQQPGAHSSHPHGHGHPLGAQAHTQQQPFGPTGGGGLYPHAISMSASSHAAAAAAAAAATDSVADALQNALRHYLTRALPVAASSVATRQVDSFVNACRQRASGLTSAPGSGVASGASGATVGCSPTVQVDDATHHDGPTDLPPTADPVPNRVLGIDNSAGHRKRSDTRPPSNGPAASAFAGSEEGEERGAAAMGGTCGPARDNATCHGSDGAGEISTPLLLPPPRVPTAVDAPTAHATARLLGQAVFGADSVEGAALRSAVEEAVRRVLQQQGVPEPYDDESSGVPSPLAFTPPRRRAEAELPASQLARQLPAVSIAGMDGCTTDESTGTSQGSPYSATAGAALGPPAVVVLPPDAEAASEPMTRSESHGHGSRAEDSVATVAAPGAAIGLPTALTAAGSPRNNLISHRAPSADLSFVSSIAISSVSASLEPTSPNNALLRGSTNTTATAVVSADSAAGSPVRMLRGLRASSGGGGGGGGSGVPRRTHAQSSTGVVEDGLLPESHSPPPSLHPGYSFTHGTVVAGSSAAAARRLSRVRTVIAPGATAATSEPALLRPEMCFKLLGSFEHSGSGARAPLIPPLHRGSSASGSAIEMPRADVATQTSSSVPPGVEAYAAMMPQEALLASIVDAATSAAQRAGAAVLARVMGVVVEALETVEVARAMCRTLPSPQHAAAGTTGGFGNDSFGAPTGNVPQFLGAGGGPASAHSHSGGSRTSPAHSSLSSWAAYSRAPAAGGMAMATFTSSPSLGGPPSVGSATVFRPSGAPVPPVVTLSASASPNLGNSVSAMSAVLPLPTGTHGRSHTHVHINSGHPNTHHAGGLHPLQRADSIATSLWGISLSEPVPVPTATAVDAEGEHEVDGTYTLNQYVVLHAIGQGTQGSVMFAMDTQANAFRAIKAIPRPGGVLRGTESRAVQLQHMRKHQHIKREVDAMHRCGRHPGIVQLYEVIDDPAHPTLYLVTQYAENGSVATCSSAGTVDRLYSAVDVGSMGRQLCNALQHMHGRGVIHRDIKPENILACADGRVMLCDFGMADVSAEVSGATPLAPPARSEFVTSMDSAASAGVASVAGGLYGLHQQHAHGTRAFYSPEQWSSIKAESPEKCDVWALGLTLYALYYGRLPWPVHPVGHYMHHVLHDDVPFPPAASANAGASSATAGGASSVHAAVPPMPTMLQDVLRAMLKRDPRERCDVRTARAMFRTAHVALLGIEAATTALESGGRLAGSRRQSNIRVLPPPALVELAAAAGHTHHHPHHHNHHHTHPHSASLLMAEGAGAIGSGSGVVAVDPPHISGSPGTDAASPNTEGGGGNVLPFATTSLRSGITTRSMLSLRSGIVPAAAVPTLPVRRIADVFSDDDDADADACSINGTISKSSHADDTFGGPSPANGVGSHAPPGSLGLVGDGLDPASRAGSGVSSQRSGQLASQSMSPNFGLILPHYHRHSSSGVVGSAGGAAAVAMDSASGRGSSSNHSPRLQLPPVTHVAGGAHHHSSLQHQSGLLGDLEPGSPLAMTTRVASGFATQQQLQAAARLASSQLVAGGHFGVSVASMNDNALSMVMSTDVAPALLLN